MFNHSVSDIVASIKNGFLAGKLTIESPYSALRENVLQILKNEGLILNLSKIKSDKGFEKLVIHLKYHNSSSVISEIKVVSKPGRRVYCKSNAIPLIKNGLGIVIMSTPAGVISGHDAKAKGLGGEVLLTVF